MSCNQILKEKKEPLNFSGMKNDSQAVKFGEIIFLEKETCLQFICASCERKISNFGLYINHALSHIYELNRKAEMLQILQKLLSASTEYGDDTVYSKKFEHLLQNDDAELEYPSQKSDELKTDEKNVIEPFNERCDTGYENKDKVPEFELSNDEFELSNDDDGPTHSSEREHTPIENLSSITSFMPQRRAIWIPFICKECNKKFTTKSNLKRHMITHSNEKRFKCEICGASFKDKSNFGAHCKRHLQIKSHQCDECEKSFTTKAHVYRHKQTHTGERPFVCEICGNCYSSSCSLSTHLLRHQNLRQHICNICAKGFYTKMLLKDHMISHSTERPFKCQKCGTAFKSKKSLHQHSKLHLNLYEYKCQYCEKAFQQCAGLHSHVKSVHKNIMW